MKLIKKFSCSKCGHIRDVSLVQYICHMHVHKVIYAKCPHCNKRGWMHATEKYDKYRDDKDVIERN